MYRTAALCNKRIAELQKLLTDKQLALPVVNGINAEINWLKDMVQRATTEGKETGQVIAKANKVEPTVKTVGK